jgi:hypothetical protein
MTSSFSFEPLMRQFDSAIFLLERLHVLSQTEALVLETSNLTELPALVTAKEAIVEEIRQTDQRLIAALAEVEPLWCQIPPAARESLKQIKERTFLLMKRICEVEENNRIRLESLRAQTLTSLQIVREDHELHHAYHSPAAVKHFSRVAD